MPLFQVRKLEISMLDVASPNEQHKERNEVELDSLASEPCPLRDIHKGSGMVSVS